MQSYFSSSTRFKIKQIADMRLYHHCFHHWLNFVRSNGHQVSQCDLKTKKINKNEKIKSLQLLLER